MDISPINSTTFKTRLGDDEVIIGGKDPLVFEPEICFTKWNKENSLTIKPLFDIPNATTLLVGNKIEHKGDKIGWYANPDGAENMKFGLILYEKPDPKYLTPDEKYYKFDFQLEDNNEYNYFNCGIVKGNRVWDGEEWVIEYQPNLFRREIYQGAISVKHKVKRDHEIGKMNYMLGNVGIFYRPKFIDVNSKLEYADITIKDGVYSITIPKEFFDTAEYPVKANDVFGNSNEPVGDYYGDSGARSVVGRYQLTAGGSITKLTFYTRGSDGTVNQKALIYSDTTGPDPLTKLGVGTATSVDTTSAWKDLAFGTPVVLSAAYLWIGSISDGNWRWYNSATTGGNVAHNKDDNYTTPETPYVVDEELAYQLCIYATYTPAAATSTTGEKYPTSATTSATGAHIDDDFVRTAAIMTANVGTADAACISASTFDAGDQTYILKATNFDFSGILAGSQINGVICRFEGWANTSGATAVSVACDLAQLLDTSRAETGENIVSSGLWTTVFLSATTGIVSLGNSANLWSCALTADWVKNANFGVALGFITGVANTDVFIDYVTLEIVYTPPAAVAALSLMYHFIEC